MEYRKLGRTDIDVSVICLGTMTWGEQNTEQEAHEQLDYALDRGINFIDTAEMYPVPPKEETYTLTEQYIGNWLAGQDRSKIILATKVAGRAAWLPYVRAGKNQFDKANITQAVEGSLKRLKTDYIDLYQLHWPDRKTNFFGQLGYKIPKEEETVPIEETLEVLNELVHAGKIRHVGLSNETPWGTMSFLAAAEKNGHPRMVSIQNPYSLLNRTFEVGNAEIAHREGVGLLAYSPLGFGVLTGKYRGGKKPEGARLTLYKRFSRYTNDIAAQATEKYCQLAEEKGLTPAKLALAFVNRQPFVTSNIIGATSMDQLKEDIDSIDVTLDKETLKAIEAIHTEMPNPAP